MAIAFVQQRASTSSADAQSLAFNSNVGAGSLLLVFIRESEAEGEATPTVTDSLDNTYWQAGASSPDSGDSVTLYYAVSGSAGACTVSVDGSTNSFLRLAIQEYSGDWGEDPFDQYDAVTASTLTSPAVSPAITPSSAAALVIALCGSVSDITYTGAGTDWTLGVVAMSRLATAHRIVTSAAAYSASFEWTGTANGAAASIASFVESAPSAPTITTQPTSISATDRTTANFTTAATGTGDLAYQWLVDKGAGFVNVDSGTGGTSASYTTGTLQPAMSTWGYACDVTDDNGTTRTDTATLTVTPGPTHILLFQAP